MQATTRIPIIAANWKMNTSLADAHILASGVLDHAEDLDRIEIVLCPPSVWLTELAHHYIPLGVLPHLKLGAQNMHYEEKGAFTGEISPLMVRELAQYVILGHSERTHLFHEDTELTRRKLQAAVKHGLTPILCLGEDAKGEQTKRHLVHQLDHLLAGLTESQIEKLAIAYEPVWAIGTGTPATPEYMQEVLAALRHRSGEKVRLLYGGSVTAENAGQFLAQEDCDGLLIGGASLSLKAFLTICQQAERMATV